MDKHITTQELKRDLLGTGNRDWCNVVIKCSEISRVRGQHEMHGLTCVGLMGKDSSVFLNMQPHHLSTPGESELLFIPVHCLCLLTFKSEREP